MVECGAFQEGPDLVEITGVGAGAYDGWQVVMEFDDNTLPNGTDREGFFVVTGWVGQSTAGGAVRAKIQVGLREKGLVVPFDMQVLVVSHSSQAMQAQFSILQGVSFQTSVAYIVGDRGKYQPAGPDRRLELVARTYLDGDPPTVAPKFEVFRSRMMFWDLSALTTDDWFHYKYAPVGGSLAGISGGNAIKVNCTSSNLPFNAVIGQQPWLIFQRVSYEPTTASIGTSADPVQLEFASGAPPLSPRRYADPGISHYLDPKWFGRLNLGAGLGIRETYSDGAIDLLTVKDNNTVVGFRSWDPTQPTTGGTVILSAEWLAIRYWKLPRINSRVHRDNWYKSTAAAKLYNGAQNPSPVAQNFEPLLKGVTGNLMIGTYSVNTRKRGLRSDAGAFFSEVIGTNKGVLYGSGLHQIALVGSTPAHLSLVQQRNVTSEEPQLRQFGMEHPVYGKDTDGWYGMDTRIVTWHFELDAEVFRKNRKPPPPPAVVVIPGREAADLSALTALPVEPETIIPEQIDVGGERSLRPPMGYRIQWPLFSAARSVVEFTFAVEEADRATITAFFQNQAQRAFKWTPRNPGASAVAYAAISDPQETQLSTVGNGFFRVTVRCVELLWTGVNI